MFKKILCLAIAVMMVMAMATVAVSAAQVDISENAADTPAQVGADSGADTGADGGADTAAGGSTIYFDTNGTGWSVDKVAFHIWAIDDDSFEGKDWGAKAQVGTDEGNGVWSYDISAKLGATIQSGKQYCVIFYEKTSGAQTYNLLFGAECLGKTASCNGTTYENPEDSNKTAMAAFWGGGIDPEKYGPELKISSIGTVVGTCCPASTSPYAMFVKFLQDTLTNARTFSGKDDQTLIDDTAKALKLQQGDVENAIKESGVEGIAWDKSKSTLESGENPDSHTTGDGGNDGSSSGSGSGSGSGSDGSGSDGSGSDGSSSGSSGTTGGGSSSSGSSSSGSTSGSGSGSQTGQETTVLFIVLGVMAAAAGVIFFARKKENA